MGQSFAVARGAMRDRRPGKEPPPRGLLDNRGEISEPVSGILRKGAVNVDALRGLSLRCCYKDDAPR